MRMRWPWNKEKDELGSRAAAKAYADLRGFFWMPCPLCNLYFSGHEWSLNNYASIPSISHLRPGFNPLVSTYHGVCPRANCTEVAGIMRRCIDSATPEPDYEKFSNLVGLGDPTRGPFSELNWWG